jgi:taurine dioxygenase
MSVAVHRIADALGAEISGVDLSRDLDDDLFDRIHTELMNHHVIFFRDQAITPERHKAFAGRFGELYVHPFAPTVEGHPELIVLHADAANPPRTNHWHADGTFMKTPHMGSVLLAREVPEAGGDTLWVNLCAAFEALPDERKRRLSSLTAVHDAANAGGRALWIDLDDADEIRRIRDSLPPVVHPVVRTHPVTARRSLFVNPTFTSHIVGMGERESAELLDSLFEHAKSPEFQCRFRWRQDSMAVWDNRCTMHFAMADYWPYRRIMHRATIVGDRPV